MKQRVILVIISLFTSAFAFAAESTETAESAIPGVKTKWLILKGFTFQDFLIIATVVLIVVVTLLTIYLLSVMKQQMKLLQKIIATKNPKAILDEETWLEKFSKKFIGLKPLEMEGELIMEEHEYDGIVELKNGMPPWLQAFFAVTVLFAISYWTYYMVLKVGPDQYEEYQIQVDKAKKEKDERNKLFSSSIDENNVELSTEESDISHGKKIFLDNCATCHRADAASGGGMYTGPNLTDEYWIHGGGIKNVFKTIKNGYIEKGMPAWIDKLSPLQIKQVASFVLSLQGTNPPGGKAPQGELWTGEKVTADSTSLKTDSLQMDSMVTVK